MGTQDHKDSAPVSVSAAVLTVSTSRSLDEDRSGAWIRTHLEQDGHNVLDHRVVPDDIREISAAIKEVLQHHAPQVILVNGGTGITPSDVTVEAVRPLFSKELTAFGALFAQLSYEEIGSAALLSRAVAGIMDNTLIFSMPGSLGACKLACTALIFPELGHLVKHLRHDT